MNEEEIERLKEAGRDAMPDDEGPEALSHTVTPEDSPEIIAFYAQISTEIVELAHQYGCNCQPHVYIYLLFEEMKTYGARVKHEDLCIGQMRNRGKDGFN